MIMSDSKTHTRRIWGCSAAAAVALFALAGCAMQPPQSSQTTSSDYAAGGSRRRLIPPTADPAAT